jgi:hypothetical protein
MPQMTNSHDDVREVPEELVGFMGDRGWSLTDAAAADVAEELKGKALDQALEEAGLPKSGSADEKRARLAEHIATTAEEQS